MPLPVIAIVLLAEVVFFSGIGVRVTGDIGELPDTLPVVLIPDIPLTLETRNISLPTKLAMAIVGTLENLMTASIVVELNDTTPSKNRKCIG